MHSPDSFQTDLVKLAGGARLLRLTYRPLELVLETKLNPAQPVVTQKERLLAALEAAVVQTELIPG